MKFSNLSLVCRFELCTVVDEEKVCKQFAWLVIESYNRCIIKIKGRGEQDVLLVFIVYWVDGVREALFSNVYRRLLMTMKWFVTLKVFFRSNIALI